MDTNVLLAIMHPVPNAMMAAWLPRHLSSNAYLTSIAEADFHGGIVEMPVGGRYLDFVPRAKGLVDVDFLGKVLTFDCIAARKW